MDADNDWWKAHRAFRPEHAKFRNVPPANLTQLDVMFKKAHVIGEASCLPRQEETGDDKKGAIQVDDDDDPSKRTPLRKRKTGGGEKDKEGPFSRVYSNALNSLVSRERADVGSSCSKDDVVPTMKEFLEMVQECGVSEGTGLMFTACKLAVKREYREVLASLKTSPGRLHYLEKMHDEMNN